MQFACTWADLLRIGCWLAPLAGVTGLFSFLSFPVWDYHLSIGCSGKSERRGLSPEFSFWVSIFVSATRLPGFISSTTGFSHWSGQEQEAPSPVTFSEKATQTSGICFEVKFRSGLCISTLKFWLRFVTIPYVYLAFASGGAGTSSPPRR